MLNRSQASPTLPRRSRGSHAIAKPSRHFGQQFWCADGPFHGKRSPYRGKRVQVKATLKATGRETIGEYRHTWRHLGNRQGYLHYYQWYGATS